MKIVIEKYKGIHPGLILERELKKRNLKKGAVALSLHEAILCLVPGLLKFNLSVADDKIA